MSSFVVRMILIVHRRRGIEQLVFFAFMHRAFRSRLAVDLIVVVFFKCVSSFIVRMLKICIHRLGDATLFVPFLDVRLVLF